MSINALTIPRIAWLDVMARAIGLGRSFQGGSGVRVDSVS